MNRRILPTLVVLVACSFPAAAVAQTTTYPQTTSTSTYPQTTPTTTATMPTTNPKAPAKKPKKAKVAGVTAQATTPTSTSTVSPASTSGVAPAASTGTTPTTLAYTGSDVWLVALLGAFALVGGLGLVRSSRSPS